MTAAKFVPLATWAAEHFEPVPSDWVLRNLARDGKIHPAPIKLGREWRVRADALLMVDGEPVRGSAVGQLQAAGM